MFFHRKFKETSQRKEFFRQEKGAVILIWALALIPLMGMLGIAIDAGRIYYVHSIITGAVDAAAIAGAKTAGTNGNIVGKATAIFNANIPSDFGGTINGPTITLTSNNQIVNVSATATIPTTFMMLLGQNSISASANSQAQISNPGTEIVLALDNTGSMAGSPMAAEIQAAKTLVNIVYGGAGINTVPNLYVAIVPYTTTVNIGANKTSWLRAAGKIQVTNTNLYPNIAPTATSVGGRWMGCIEARTPPLYAAGMDTTDTTPSGTSRFIPFLYPSTMAHQYVFGQPLNRGTTATSTTALAVAGSPPWGNTGSARGDNDWKLDGTVPNGSLHFGDNYSLQAGNGDGNFGVGPNLGCPIPMLPLTASQATVQSTISNMKATFRGGTMINVGLASAWWMISPKWQGLWTGVPATLPKAYDQTNKFLVLMTDGQNQWYDWPVGMPGTPSPAGAAYQNDADYTGYGRLAEGRSGTTVFANTIPLLNTRMSAMCEAIKANNVTIYTILFNHNGSAGGAATQLAFQNCASDPSKYFFSASNQDLQDAFSQIGQSITKLRLTWPGKP